MAERVAANGGSSAEVVPNDGVSSRSSDRDDVDEAEMDREANGGEEDRNSTGKQEDEENNELDLDEEEDEEEEEEDETDCDSVDIGPTRRFRRPKPSVPVRGSGAVSSAAGLATNSIFFCFSVFDH